MAGDAYAGKLKRIHCIRIVVVYPHHSGAMTKIDGKTVMFLRVISVMRTRVLELCLVVRACASPLLYSVATQRCIMSHFELIVTRLTRHTMLSVLFRHPIFVLRLVRPKINWHCQSVDK